MPIQLENVTSRMIGAIKQEIDQLLNTGLLPMHSEPTGRLRLTSIIPIQRLETDKSVKLKTESPEGYRVLVSIQGKIIFGCDFYFKESVLTFSHAFSGKQLEELVGALQAVETIYQHKKLSYHISLLDFFHAGHPYLMVYYKKPVVYNFYNQQLHSMPLAELKTLLKQLKHSKLTLSSI
jgi:hypothetical protein